MFLFGGSLVAMFLTLSLLCPESIEGSKGGEKRQETLLEVLKITHQVCDDMSLK